MISRFYFQFFLMGIVSVGALEKGPGCTEVLNEGTGQEKTLAFYYNGDIEACLPFFYKGEGGNNNRFATEKQCLANCSSKYKELYPEGEEVCNLQMDPGSCFARIVKFYYDKEEKACRLFLYGGCQGNGNHFETKEDCEQMCRGKAGRTLGGAPSPDEQTVDVGLIVGILGGVVFAVAVIATIALLVIQRKAKRTDMKKVPTTDVEMT